MTSNSRLRWMRIGGVFVICLLLIFSLIGGAAQPRTLLGWQLEHFLAYFIATLIVGLGWPRPLMVAGAMVVLAGVLEGLQAFTPDRNPNFFAAVYGAAGVLTAALLAELLIRARQRNSGSLASIKTRR